MELKNTNFKNIKIDDKENTVYKFLKAKNNSAIEEFDFFKKHVFQLSRSINFIPNITVWERNEYNLVIGMNLIKKSTSLKTVLKNNILITKKNLINYYRFMTYEVPNSFIKYSTKNLKDGCIINNVETGSYYNYLENILIDDKGKFWYLPYSSLKYVKEIKSVLSYTDKFTKRVTFDFYNKFNRNQILEKTNIQIEKYKNQILKKDQISNTIISQLEKERNNLQNERIKYSELQKILGDKLFTQYFGDNDDI